MSSAKLSHRKAPSMSRSLSDIRRGTQPVHSRMPSNTETTRYDPYQAARTQAQRNRHASAPNSSYIAPLPRLLPAAPSTSAPNAQKQAFSQIISPKPKPKDPSRPNGLYQPSRGAQRDAKWKAKLSKTSHEASSILGTTSAPVSRASSVDIEDRQYNDQRNCSYGVQRQNGPGRILSPRRSSSIPRYPIIPRPTTIGGPLPPLGNRSMVGFSQTVDEQMRREQQAAINAARESHRLEVQRQTALKEEYERKTQRIQLQVFVHARATQCEWQACRATLNSWAVLEKHLNHSHLHPQSTPCTGPGEVVHCSWGDCGRTSTTPEDCYRHCLTDHMATFSARCPFNCLYEGPNFSELMAHIARRHPKATPDDFIPGLIHYIPTLPSTNELPGLPDPRVIPIPEQQIDETTETHSIGERLKVWRPAVSPKATTTVARGCVALSGRRSRRDGWAEKKGAMAAIGAVIRNCASTRQTEVQRNSEMTDTSVSVSPKGLLDPEIIRKEAIKVARQELRKRGGSISTGYSTGSDSESSNPVEHDLIVNGPRPSSLRRGITYRSEDVE